MAVSLSRSTRLNRSQETGSLRARVDDARWWLYDQALPLWGEVGVDGDCGFVDHLSLDGRPGEVGDKRLRVQARQVYVFSHASHLGYQPGLAIARRGWHFMRRFAWSDDGGWARRLARHGEVLDPTLDLYDQAFALLAIAWWIRASGEDDVGWADRTLAVIDERLASPTGIGWLSEAGPAGALLQNPHMHLLEALLALYATTGEVRFKTRIEEILELFDLVLFDSATGTLAEYYDAGWGRLAGDRGRIVEPGHHYEWVWLLHQAEQVIPGSADRANALLEFAERFGCDSNTGLVYDEVRDDGIVRKASHRSWPNMEALKAHLACFDSTDLIDVGRTTRILDNLFRYFLHAPTSGTWIDQVDFNCDPCVDKIPASTLYHVFLAFSELLRLEPRLQAAAIMT
jgi:mannose/cellobiose epimerase-like protein (N-acyl-D-glucosamine 2-epimerase family)